MPRQACAKIHGKRRSKAPSSGSRLLCPGIKLDRFLVSEKATDNGLAFSNRTDARAQNRRAHIAEQEK